MTTIKQKDEEIAEKETLTKVDWKNSEVVSLLLKLGFSEPFSVLHMKDVSLALKTATIKQKLAERK